MNDLVAAGERALKAGDWSAARDAYSAALVEGESGGVLFGLGIALWWLGETRESVYMWERAYAEFRSSSEPEPAVITAVYLCLAYRMSLGNDAAASGWVERAASLADELELGPVAGFVLLARAYTANDSGQPSVAERQARRALTIALETGDTGLALCATGELGAALVAMGDFEGGAALVDQAMAAALAGEADDLDSVVLVSCRTITTCSRAGDVKRAVQWIRAADDFHRRYGSTHLFTTCRTHHGAILFAVGAWHEAEAELEIALRLAGSAEPALRAEAAAKLAELRLAQGDTAQAAQLLAGLENYPVTTSARAALLIATGEPRVAASVLRRRLRQLDERSVERAILTDRLLEARGDDDLWEHEIGVTRLSGGAGIGHAVARGYACRAAGRAMVAAGDMAAVDQLDGALSAFGSAEMPYECARTRLLIAETVAGDDPDTAVAEARAALHAFEALGALRDADAAAALLRSFGVKAARSGAKGVGVLTNRELEVLGLLGEGLSNPAIADRLFISRRTVEHHVTSVLRKLGLSGRTEAAAFAVRHLGRDSTPK